MTRKPRVRRLPRRGRPWTVTYVEYEGEMRITSFRSFEQAIWFANAWSRHVAGMVREPTC